MSGDFHAKELPMKVLLKVDHLKVSFPVFGGVFRNKIDEVKAVDDVSFEIKAGSTVGLVGESGSGKTTIGRAIARLVPCTAGNIVFEGTDILSLSRQEFRPFRKQIQMVFQDPYGSLNPRMTVCSTVGEALDIHFKNLSRSEKEDRIEALLQQVGLQADAGNRYPHEFSGGQRQRIGIARALAVEPRFLICDEPVSALDVSVQAQIVNLLKDLQEELGLTYLFIAHDLAVVQHMSDQVLVLYHGQIVEAASSEEIYEDPQHDYTKKLLAAVPALG